MATTARLSDIGCLPTVQNYEDQLLSTTIFDIEQDFCLGKNVQ